MAQHVFPWREPFLAALRQWPVLSHACDVVGIERSTAHRARKADPEFDAAVNEALEAGVDRAELEAFQRGVHGVEEPVIYQGRLQFVYERYLDEDGVEQWRMKLDDKGQPIPLTVRKPSDAMLGRVLAARRASYRTQATEITNPDGSLAPVDETARAARAAQLLEIARQRQEADRLERDFGHLA